MKHYGFEIYSKKKHRRPHLRSVRFHGANNVALASQGATIEMPQDISMFTIAKILLRFLAKHGATRTPFIFQQVATKDSVKKLASAIISERDLDLSTYPIETIATTLKRILRALPIPIIHCQEHFFAILRDGADLEEIIPQLRTLLKAELHPDSFSFLVDLVKLLSEIAACHEQTQMTANSLAYIFGPTLMRLKTDSTIALLHDPKAINRAVEFLIQHFDEIFASTKKGKTGVDSSESRPISKSRLLQKKIKMVLRKPFGRTSQPSSNYNIEQGISNLAPSGVSPRIFQSSDQALYTCIVLTDDEREKFRQPPPWNPPDLPPKQESSGGPATSSPSSPRKLFGNFHDGAISESGRYRMQLDAAKAEQIFVENARKRQIQFLDEERRAQEAFTLRRTYSGNLESPKSVASSPVASETNHALIQQSSAPADFDSAKEPAQKPSDVPQRPDDRDQHATDLQLQPIGIRQDSILDQVERTDIDLKPDVLCPEPKGCCESDASTSSTRTSISSRSSQSVEDLEAPLSPETDQVQSSWWKDVQQLRDAADAATSDAVATPVSVDIPLDFDNPPTEPAPIKPYVDSETEEASSIESISDVSNGYMSGPQLHQAFDTDSPRATSVSSVEQDELSSQQERILQQERDLQQQVALERTATVVAKKMHRPQPSSHIAKRMQMFESRQTDDDDAASSHISLKSIRAPGGIVQRRANVTKFKQIFEKQPATVDVDDQVVIIESSPRNGPLAATSVVRKDQWHAEAAREAPDTTLAQKGYVQRVRNRLLSDPSASSSMPPTPSSRRSSADNNWNDDSPLKIDWPEKTYIQRIAQPAIIRKLSMSRVQNLGRKLVERHQSLDLLSERSSLSIIPNHRMSLSETSSLKPFVKGAKNDELLPEQITTLPSGFYRIQNARRRNIRGGPSQFSASDDSEDDDEIHKVDTIHRTRPSLSATAFMRRLSTASSFADDSVPSSRTASVQALDLIIDGSRNGSQIVVPSVMTVSISQVANETPIRNAII